MKRLNLAAIMVLMGVSLAGIILLQLMWLLNTERIRKDEFNTKVAEALNSTVVNVENLESLIIIQSADFSDTITYANDTLSNVTWGNNPENDPFYSDRYAKRKEKMQNMLSKVFWEYQSDQDNEYRKKIYPLIDSILNNELKRHNINLPYEYAVLSAGLDQPEIASAGFINDTAVRFYRIALFPNSVIPAPQILVLNFKGEQTQILREMLFMLGGNFIFTFIIIATIIISLRTIVRQKKLAEIKSDFINNMTHEFKTPIATISLATDAIDSPVIKEDLSRIKYYTGIIREENRRMNMQVENILQMAIIDKNEATMNLTVHDVVPLVRKVADVFMLHVKERNGTLSLQINVEKADALVDDTHFCNLISNLLDNAIKYSQGPPEITVKTWFEKDKICISVVDKGIGISRDAKKFIFEKFYRGHTGDVHNVKGFGLGLTYARAVAVAFKGDIDVKSEPGMGSVFTVRLPLYV